ncbi:sensor [Pseudomonas putida]|uniref:Sensor n=1 Tax=Pseudomonas putida TaxID=303 RepID=A0AA37RCT9_PSEPU|nr:FecR domain-containing protein [Pseudomonas putida]GLO13398.1 sensor [Pseudomonas putida]GLO36580.1 sensor [Pseudomonas putida]HDS0963187.1 FecR domain-containing protein [Pseudomonas putida]HDS0991648.1 FecR domain-containing protein [Pseudomonas putida]
MKRVLAQAVDWYVRLHDSAASDSTRSEWRAWLAADPQHARAWQRIEQLQQRLGQAPAGLAGATLEQARQQRRAAMKMLALLLGVGVVGWRGYQVSPWRADYSTGVGLRRHFTLVDGSRLVLGTDSRVDVQFDGLQRLILLRQGEVLVETAKDARPLSVQTAEGRVLALGTRFTVRQGAGISRVTVEAHAVEVQPRLATGQILRIEAGQASSFTADTLGPLLPAVAQGSAWTQGMLVVVDWRLADVLAELSRYRPGYLGCAPEVAGLRLSGTFLLDDSEGVLANLEDSLPVRVRRLTRYWVRVEGKAA